MSKKIGLDCPTCGATLFVKRAVHKVANHPLYAKKGKLIVNYSHSVHTEFRDQKLWLRCLSCPFLRQFDTEDQLRAHVGALMYDQVEKVQGPKPKKQSKAPELPMIVQPSQMELEDESI